MKIVFLTDDFPPLSFGGAGISTYEIALGMKRAGYDVFVITTCRKDSEVGEFDYEGLKIYRLVSNYPGRWRSYLSLYNPPIVRQVKKLFKKIDPDVVHANNIHFYLSYHCLKLAKQFSKVVVWTARDAMAFNYGKLNTKRYLENFDYHTTWRDHFKQAGKRWNPLRNFLIRRYLGYADTLFAVSQALKNALEKNKIKNVEVMHTGARVLEWQVSQDLVANFKMKHSLSNKKVVFFAGRLSESKGGRKALEALIEVLKTNPDAVLLVAGPSDEYSQIMMEQVKERGLPGQFVFAGWIERGEIKTAYAAADIVLVPSIYLDPFPRMVIEAMACGKPVVGTCYGGVSEIIVDGITGYVVNPFHTKEMAGKIIRLLVNPDQALKFGKAGQERIRTNFNLDDKIKDIVFYYEKNN